MRAFIVSWEESERGWAVRFDGVSVHLSEEHAKQYEDDYWSKQPDAVPDEYERPILGSGRWIEIDDPMLIEELNKTGNVRLYKHSELFKRQFMKE